MRLHSPRESFLWLKALWQHRRNQRLSRAALEALQREKFRRLAIHAYRHSAYYRELMDRRGIDVANCAPGDFPILTKEEVIANFDEMVTDRSVTRKGIAEFLEKSADPEELFQGRYHVLHTSGTSGTVGYYVFSHEAWIRGCTQVVGTSALKFRRRVAYVAATRGHFAGVSLIMAGNDGTNALFYNVRTMDVGRPLGAIIEELNRFQPQTLSGYATMLKVLAEAQERGELRIAPSEVGSGGEPLAPEVRRLLERTFRAPVKNAYASSEHLYMALTLPGTDGLSLLEDDLIFELEPQHTCVTNLFNPLLPLIRYQMDDVLVPRSDVASRYPFTMVKEIIGRQEQALVFTNEHGREDFIHPIVIVEFVVKGLAAWQIVLEGEASFRFRAQLATELGEAERRAVLEQIRAKLTALLAEKEMGNVQFTIECVEALAIDAATGKFRLVVPRERAVRAALEQPCGEVFSRSQ